MPNLVTNPCVVCGSPVTVPAGQIARGRGKYCSRACSLPVTQKRKHEIASQNYYGFWERVDKSGGPSACWPWTGRISKNGYGRVKARRRTIGAHRYALMITDGEPPEHKPFACHSCDNRPCCNPAHLRWGSAKENSQDAVERGRARGGVVKIDREQVIALHRAGLSSKQIGQHVGAHPASVWRVLKAIDSATLRALQASTGEGGGDG